MFNGEKTAVFWAGLIVFGFSLFQFCNAVWQTIYTYFLLPLTYESPLAATTYGKNAIIAISYSVAPLVISGVIFVAIGLYMMKAGIRKNVPPA